jgi:hypothetical protein
MKTGSAHRVMVRPLALLALGCGVSLFISVEGTAAQSDDINEAVSAQGVTPTLELTPSNDRRSRPRLSLVSAHGAGGVWHAAALAACCQE